MAKNCVCGLQKYFNLKCLLQIHVSLLLIFGERLPLQEQKCIRQEIVQTDFAMKSMSVLEMRKTFELWVVRFIMSIFKDERQFRFE